MLIDIGTESYPSFADLDFADVFLAGDVQRSALWAIRNDDAKGRGLVSATRMLLRLPLAPAPDPTAAAADIPETVQEVTAMLASDLLSTPRLFADASANSNVKAAKAGSASVEFFQPVKGSTPLPRAIWDMLVAAGLVGPLDSIEQTGSPFVSGSSSGCSDRPLGGRFAGRFDWPFAEADYD